MDVHRRVLGPAAVRWNDYVGTAAADDADVLLERPSLYEVAGIDRGRYTLLGVDLTIWEASTTVSVYAVDRLEHGLETHADIEELGRTRGEIPVTEFVLPAQHVEEFLEHAFKRITLRLVSRGVREQELVVVEQAG